MKTTSEKRSKFSTKWQEFVEYIESIYFPDALESMSDEAVAFEYKLFLEMDS